VTTYPEFVFGYVFVADCPQIVGVGKDDRVKLRHFVALRVDFRNFIWAEFNFVEIDSGDIKN